MTRPQGANRRPYFSKVVTYTWTKPGQPDTPGIAFIGLGGFSAHLTTSEALELSNHLVDLVEHLEPLRNKDPMPQRHDIGWKKRNRDIPSRPKSIDTYPLARKLVETGLAPAVILGPMRAYYSNKDQA